MDDEEYEQESEGQDSTISQGSDESQSPAPAPRPLTHAANTQRPRPVPRQRPAKTTGNASKPNTPAVQKPGSSPLKAGAGSASGSGIKKSPDIKGAIIQKAVDKTVDKMLEPPTDGAGVAGRALKGVKTGGPVGAATGVAGAGLAKALEVKDGEEDTVAGQAKGATKDLTKNVVGGAASGAAGGGVAGAVLGGLKGLAGTVKNNQFLRNGVIILAVLSIATSPLLLGLVTLSIAGSVSGGQGDGVETSKAQSVSYSEIESNTVESAQRTALLSSGNIPWTVILAANDRVGNSDEEQQQEMEKLSNGDDITVNVELDEQSEDQLQKLEEDRAEREIHKAESRQGVDADDEERLQWAIEDAEDAIADAQNEWNEQKTADDEHKSKIAKKVYGYDLHTLSRLMSIADPGGVYRDIAGGATVSPQGASTVRMIADTSDGGDPGAWRQHKATETLYVEAMKAANFGSEQQIFDQALEWELGTTICDVTFSQATDANETSVSGTTIDSLSEDQIANGRTIIGMAKTVHGSDWKQAAEIAIATAMRESQMLIWANDGVYGVPSYELGRENEYPKKDFDIVKRSLKYPHQRVGSDFTSVGMFQHIPKYYGSMGSSTYESDPDGVIRRLMDPEFSAWQFLTDLDRKSPGWKEMDPIEASHNVQGSAIPDGPRAYLSLAKQFTGEHSDAPKLPLPKGVDSGGGPSETAEPSNDCGDETVLGSEVVGGWAAPAADAKTLGWSTYFGNAQHAAGASDWCRNTGDPIFASAAGEVISYSESHDGGWAIVEHAPNLFTIYGHFLTSSIKTGEKVKAGQQIGTMKNVSCPHVHFVVAKAGGHDTSQFVKSIKFLKDKGVETGPCRDGDPCHLAE